MKSLLIAIYSVSLVATLSTVRADDAVQSKDSQASSTAHAAPSTDKKRPTLTAEQKALRKELVGKYDTNKDGKLDQDERKGISAEDKAKLKKAGLQARERKTIKKEHAE